MKKNKSFTPSLPWRRVLKVCLFMKFVTLIILLTSLHLSAKTFSQELLTVKLNNLSLSKALKEVEKKSSYRFVFSNMILPENSYVNMDVKAMPLDKLLGKLLENTSLSFKMLQNNLIVINSASVETKIINVKGKVIDAKGEALANVSITVNRSGKGTTTNEAGEFSLEVDDNATLNFSYVGYENLSIKVEGKADLGSIVLIETASNLTDVVVVGYGSARRKDVTGAVSSISSKEFTLGLVTNPMDQIQGKVPGLVITKIDGDPNAPVVIRLRGQTSLTGGQSPLVVVDGVIMDDIDQISNIPPGDILSYDVLKDASATSIYGARGANGVIIINTRKGRSGRTQVDYSGFASTSSVAKTPRLLNTPEFLEEAVKLGQDPAQLETANSAPGVTNDWVGAILRTGFSHNHTVSISGGTEKFNYRGSANYLNQDGIVINTGKEQIGLRFNAQQKALNDKLDIQVGIVSATTNRDLVNRNIFNWANVIPPYIRLKTAEGLDNPVYQYNYQSPVLYQNMVTNKTKEHLTQEYATVNYSIIKDLVVGLTGSLTQFNTQGDYYLPVIPGANNQNVASKNISNRDSKKGDVHVNYLKDFGKHNLSATLVHEYNYYTFNWVNPSARDFVSDANTNNAMQYGNSSLNTLPSYKEEFILLSYLARVAYNYDSKYYVTASFRRDGSSKFGINNRWANFPSVSAAWRLKGESFLKEVSWLDELKISAGYGVVGNQDAISAYNTIVTLDRSGGGYNPSDPTNLYPVGFSPTQNPNPDLVWEERHGKNIGLEFAMLSNRLTGSISAYNDETRNLLFNYTVRVPPNIVGNVLANIGRLTNKGVELQLNADVVRSKDLNWSVGGQITTVNTKVTSLAGTWQNQELATDNIAVGSASGRGLSSNPITFLIVDKAPFTFKLPHYVGMNEDGLSLFETADHQTTTNYLEAENRYINPYPKFTYGFSTNLSYKNFAFNVFLRGVSGAKIFNNTNLNLANYNNLPSVNALKEAVTSGLRDNPTPSDYWLENASYMRLESLTLSYNLPKIKGIDNLRVYLSGNNLFVITKYKGLDPEIAPVNNQATPAFIDLTYSGSGGYYPKARSITFGVNVSFK